MSKNSSQSRQITRWLKQCKRLVSESLDYDLLEKKRQELLMYGSTYISGTERTVKSSQPSSKFTGFELTLKSNMPRRLP